jgi:cyanobactin cluster PatC/TenC/TruC protein
MTDSTTGKARMSGKPREPARARGSKPASDLAAAQNAIEIAAATAPGEPPVPVPVPTAHSFGAGLADYGMWVEMFTHAPPATPDEPYSRGRIWA